MRRLYGTRALWPLVNYLAAEVWQLQYTALIGAVRYALHSVDNPTRSAAYRFLLP